MNTFKKELLLLLRDPSGLLLLLIMPSILLFVMTYVQDAPFKDYQEMHFDVLIYNEDQGKISKQIIQALDTSPHFSAIQSINGKAIDEETFHAAIKEGHYTMGIKLPSNTTKSMVKATNKIADDIAKTTGMPRLNSTSLDSTDQAVILLMFDPTVKPAMRTSLSNALQQYLLQSKFDILLERLGNLNTQENNTNTPVLNASAFNNLVIKEEMQGQKSTEDIRINSVQHNVPAWSIFGMFMIVVPLAGNILKEKADGSDMRVRLIPGAFAKVMLGKLVFYFSLCLVQFVFMLCIGLFIIPLLGLPQLQLGAHPITVVPVVASISLMAVSYGLFIGSIFKTANQAMPFGAISIVILSAIGGIWVPLEVLPPLMQKIALFSPLYWSLEGVNNIFLRDLGWTGIILPCTVLLLSSAVALAIAYFKNKNVSFD